MKEYLLFQNPGVLDLNFLRLMGVSVKDSNSAIGLFGTGLKYAIATILRLGGSVEILTDGVRHLIRTQEIELRGKTFNQIILDNVPVGITTELGKQWEAWMAIRELYSNALDEGGGMSRESVEVMPSKGKTFIIVRGEPFLEVYENKDRYFIEKAESPISSGNHMQVFNRVSTALSNTVFYKGICVGAMEQATLYRYNIKDKIDLTEDRTIRYEFQIREAIEKTIITSTDKDFIRKSLTSKNAYEAQCMFNNSYSSIEPSAEFLTVCGTLSEQRPKELNVLAIEWYKKRANKREPLEFLTPTATQKRQIEKSKDCLNRMGFERDLELFPIRIVNWLGEDIMGRALNKEILISKECFDKGTKYLCSTILEEFIHCRYGYEDCTRELQTWLFDRLITLAEDHILGDVL